MIRAPAEPVERLTGGRCGEESEEGQEEREGGQEENGTDAEEVVPQDRPPRCRAEENGEEGGAAQAGGREEDSFPEAAPLARGGDPGRGPDSSDRRGLRGRGLGR